LADEASQLGEAAQERVVTLSEAAMLSGYSPAHLGRLAKEGKVRCRRPKGSRGRLTFRIADLPRKPVATHTTGAGVHELASRLFRGKEGHHGQS
jgi:hypothetical protein